MGPHARAPAAPASTGERLDALGPWLSTWRHLWSTPPFKVHRPAWLAEHPEVGAWLLGLDEGQIAALEGDPHADDGPAPWRELATQARALAAVPALGHAVGDPRDPLARKVRGRKWTQVTSFLEVAGPALRGAPGPVVEWCAGRGHLGRTLAARLGRPGVLLEKDPHLCAPPEGRPEREGVRHACVDVLDDAVADLVPAGAAVLGLHACGRLTDRLLDVALARGAAGIAAAPCCPHRQFGREVWAPTSRRAAAHGLTLSLDELRLPVLDEVVARPRRRHLRRRELLLRVAVDLLAREATGQDRHFGFPSIPRHHFDQPLEGFVRWAAEVHQLPLPVRWSPDGVEIAAQQQVRRIRALGVARMLFRRPLELWLVLDRAQRLVEAGWDVEVGTFCRREATPRNLVVLGTA